MYPHKFTQYLLSEVGFSKCEVIGAPFHQSRGFQRPIKLYTKGETPTTERTPATVVSDQTPATSSSDRTPAVFFDHKHASEYIPLTFSEHVPVRGSDYSPSHYYEPDYNEIMPPEALAHRPASLIDNHRHQPRNRLQDILNEHGSDSSGVYSETPSVLDGHSPNNCNHSVQIGNSEKCELCLNKITETSVDADSQEPERIDSHNSATVSGLEDMSRCTETEVHNTSVITLEHVNETNQISSTHLAVSTITVAEMSQNDKHQQQMLKYSNVSVGNESIILSENYDIQESTSNIQTITLNDTMGTSTSDETQESPVCTQSSTFVDDETSNVNERIILPENDYIEELASKAQTISDDTVEPSISDKIKISSRELLVCTLSSISADNKTCNENEKIILSENSDIQESAPNTQSGTHDDIMETTVSDETNILSQETLVCTQSSISADEDDRIIMPKNNAFQKSASATDDDIMETSTIDETKKSSHETLECTQSSTLTDDTLETSASGETKISSQETLVCTQSSTFADDEMTESSKSGCIQETAKST